MSAVDPLAPMARYEDLYEKDNETRSGSRSEPEMEAEETAEFQGGWPIFDPGALHGLAGQVVSTIEPETEADRGALLLDFLVSFGSAVTDGPHAVADGSKHPARLNAVLVGETSRSRKGTSRAQIRRVMAIADPDWSDARVMGGLASGEGLIAAVRDGDPNDDEDTGVTDKRLMVVEPEFARVLRVAARAGNTLSAVIRDAWDSGRLRVMTRTAPLVATGAHISVLCHITVDELRRGLADSEAANGYANRYLFALVRRSKLLPNGGNLDDEAVAWIGGKVRQALDVARKIGTLRRSAAADDYWTHLYARIAEDDAGGLLGAVTARAEAQVLRLSVVYALLDGSSTIEVDHIKAAEAVWRYCEASAAYVWGDAIGDEVADRLLAAIRDAGDDGLDLTAQSGVFARHVPRKRLEHARGLLEDRGLIVTRTEDTDGRPRTFSVAAKEAKQAKQGRSDGR